MEIIIIGSVLALTQAIKTSGILDRRFTPLLAIVLGIVGAIIFRSVDILDGVIMGISASGVYEVGKHTSAVISGTKTYD